MNTTTIDMAVEAATPGQMPLAAAAPTAHAAAVQEAAADDAHQAAGITERGPEIAVAALLMALGALVVFDSVRLGAGWAEDGPQSGYFPFYIGLMLVASSGFVFLRALGGWLAPRNARESSGAAGDGASSDSPLFVEHEQLRLVMAMLVPASLYVGVMAFTGLYVASIVLIAWFMRRHGRFGWALSSAVSVGVPLTVFIVFERWFLVPLPKGPIESLLGF